MKTPRKRLEIQSWQFARFSQPILAQALPKTEYDFRRRTALADTLSPAFTSDCASMRLLTDSNRATRKQNRKALIPAAVEAPDETLP